MRSFLLVSIATAVLACSADEFVSPTDSGTTGDGAPRDGGADVAAVPIAIVNQTSPLFASTGDPSADLNPSPTPGNAVIVVVTCFSEVDNCSIPTNGVTDNQGNTYRRIVEGASIISTTTHGTRGYIFIADSVVAGPGPFRITVNPNGAPDANYQMIGWAALEVAGLLPANANDVAGATSVKGDTATSTTAQTSGPTTQANELAVGLHYMRTQDDDVNYSVEAGWSQTHVNASANTSDPFSVVTRVLSAPPGIVSHTWQHDPPSRGAAAVIATFKGRIP